MSIGLYDFMGLIYEMGTTHGGNLDFIRVFCFSFIVAIRVRYGEEGEVASFLFSLGVSTFGDGYPLFPFFFFTTA